VKSVLILTAGFGEGHNAAARNLSQAIVALSPQTKVVVSDVFQEAYGSFNRLVQKGYVAMINHAPLLWQGIFHLMDCPPLVEMHMRFYGAAGKTLLKLIEEHEPEVIVSTYPGCNHLLDWVYRKRLRRPFRTVTVITDSLSVNSVWYRAHSDAFVVANEPTAAVMRHAGVPEKKIHVLGFPVPRIFASLTANRAIAPADGHWRVLYVINSGRNLAPAIVRHLLKLENVSLTVTVGRDEELGRRITSDIQAAGKTAEVYGWTPEMPRLMAENHLLISKAGGATVQETLAARTPMIITQIVPGQEEGNARLVMEHGAGALATTPEEIAGAVQNAFCNDAAQWQGWLEAAAALGRPDASDVIARYVLDSR